MRSKGLSLLLPGCVRTQEGLSAWVGKKGFLGSAGSNSLAVLGTKPSGLASYLSLLVHQEEAGASSWREEGRFAVMWMRRATGIAGVWTMECWLGTHFEKDGREFWQLYNPQKGRQERQSKGSWRASTGRCSSMTALK